MLFSVILPLIGALYPAVFATPEVHIGHTTLLGKDVTGLGQDFFGGKDQVLNEWRDSD